jgi:hypothetical protein
MRTNRILALIVCAGLASGAGIGCQGGATQKPVRTNPIETGADTIQGTRLKLQGQWTLLSLAVTSPEGKRVNVEANGVLEADQYGNLKIEFDLTDAGLKALSSVGVESPNPVISTTGHVEIDTGQKAIRYVSPDAASRAFDPKLAALRANPFALERTRYYEFAADGTLRLSTRYDDGKEAFASRWKKGP